MSFLRLKKRDISSIADPTSRAVTAEWIVAVLRPVGLAVFAAIGWFKPPGQAVDLSLLHLFILVGILFALYVFHLLSSGRFARDLPHFLTFFIICDILLLVALTYFSNIFHEGLLFFYHFLIVIIALRANFRISLIIGPIMLLAYYCTTLLLSKSGEVSASRFALDGIGLVGVSLVSGWLSERGSHAWELVGEISRDLASANLNLNDTRRELEILRHSQEMQRDFFAIVSHELRTPLTGIIGYSDLLLLGEVGALEERQREYIQEIMGKGIDLLNLIDNILNIHKIQSGRWLLSLSSVNPKTLVEEAFATIRPEALKKRVGIEFETQASEVFPDMIADGEKIKLVFLNILANAVRYTPSGKQVRVTVEIIHDRVLEERFPHLISSAEAVRFRIADQGPGVDPKDRSHIFELFYRGQGMDAHSSPSRMGLGLAVAREIIELHWGRIWYEEAPGGGSLFNVTLPLRPLRLVHKVAIVLSSFGMETLLDGLLRQFDEEVRKKRLTVACKGWVAKSDNPLIITADRQLIQSVLYNVLNNIIRYAFPGSEIQIILERMPSPERMLLRLANRGETIKESLIAQVNQGEVHTPGEVEQDLRHVHVNLALARDIIESHGGTFRLENHNNQGAGMTIILPVGEAQK